MEYVTPPSYGSTVVSAGGLVKDGNLIYAGVGNTATHTAITQDSDNGWPEPTAAKYQWEGKTTDGKPFTAVLEGSLDQRLDKVDVMAEVPGFVKSFVGAAVGYAVDFFLVWCGRLTLGRTKPYIYQYSPKPNLSLRVTIEGQETTEEGVLFTEATFISQ